MLTVHPQYIKDSDGNTSLVVLPVTEFDKLMEELEDVEDVRLYDAAKSNDNSERVPMVEAFKLIEITAKS